MSVAWFRIDDTFDQHPKVVEAGNEAIGLFIRCGTYCARNLTDGFVPREIVAWYGSPDLAEKLVTATGGRGGAGLLEAVSSGWWLHDYLDYNPSRVDVLQARLQRTERQKRWRDTHRNASTNASVDAAVDPAPARPDPSHKDGSGLRPSPSLPARTAFAQRGNAAPARPEWCGHCDPATRLFEIDGRAVRCARCHPLTQEPA